MRHSLGLLVKLLFTFQEKDGHKDYCEVSGVEIGASLVMCDFCDCCYLLECLGEEKAEDLPDPFKCPKCSDELDKCKAEWEKFFAIPDGQKRVLKRGAILEVCL